MKNNIKENFNENEFENFPSVDHEDMKCLSEIQNNLSIFEKKMNQLENNFIKKINKGNNVENECGVIEESLPKENYGLYKKNNLEVEKLVNELKYKNMLIEDLRTEMNEIQTNGKQIKSSISSPTNIRDLENLKNQNEVLKKEISIIKTTLIKTEDENSMLNSKIYEKEKEINNLERRLLTEELQNKKSKSEYDFLTNNSFKLKKEIESTTNKLEELKAENYNLKQENMELRNKQNEKNEKNLKKITGNLTQNTGQINNIIPIYGNNITPTITTTTINNTLERKNKPDHTEIYFPSEHKLKINKNELYFNQEKLSSLLKTKILFENELLKLPEKPRSMNEINSKKRIESSISEIENDINDIKLNIRRLNGK